MKYVLLLRGINVGGKNKIKMADFKYHLTELGLTHVVSYINSGNFVFESKQKIEDLDANIAQMIKEYYDFEIIFAIINEKDYLEAAQELPMWWNDNSLARRDVLFYTKQVDINAMVESIQEMKLHKEIIHFSKIAVFWGKTVEEEYLRTAYHKNLASKKYYKQITIRNGNTFEQLLKILMDQNK